MAEIGFWESAFLWRDAIIVACLAGVLLAYLGFYVVLTRSAFVALVVSALAGLGVVLSLFLRQVAGLALPPLVPAGALGMLGTALFFMPRRAVSIPNDTLLACAYLLTFAITMVAVGFLARDYQHVQSALYGDAVVASPWEITVLALLVILVGATHGLFGHRFLLVCFDPDAGRAQGMRVGVWGLGLGLTIGAAISVSTVAIGALPAFAFSVVPAATALLVTSRLRRALPLGAGLALVAASVGYYLSFVAELPTGATMVAVSLTGWIAAAARTMRRRALA